MLKKIVVGVLSFLLIVYLGGVLLFMGRYPFNSYVNGTSAFFKTPGELSLDMVRRTKSVKVEFVPRDGDPEYLTFEQMGAYRPSEMDMPGRAPSSFAWPMSFFRRTEVDLDPAVSWDDARMNKALASLSFVRNGLEDPVDAKVEQLADGTFDITPEVEGTRVDLDALKIALSDCLSGDGPYRIDLAADRCYVEPTVRAGDGQLLVARDGANGLRELDIELDLGAGTVIRIPSDVLGNCYDLSGTTAGLDPAKVAEYVEVLQETYDTYGKSRMFHTSMGSDVSVSPRSQGPCDFAGWQLDADATRDALIAALSAGQDTTVTAVWDYKGAAHGELNDFGTTYLEISIPDQHMWLYSDGELLVDTDVVTGTAGGSRATPPGIYITTDFYTEFTMHGDYGSAFCHYFIRCTLDGVGVHDSTRSAFGGNIYLTNGSHGCINTPYAKEKAIFEFLYDRQYSGSRKHTPIIIWDA